MVLPTAAMQGRPAPAHSAACTGKTYTGYYAQVIVGHAYSHHLQYLNLQLVVYKESKTRSEISIDKTSDSTQFECIKVRDLSFTISHKSNERCLTRTDSDLEAFSRDPTDSSFAVFTVQ